MGRKIVKYADFSKGEYGRKQPWNAPDGSFTGRNMLVSSTGELIVVPQYKQIPTSGQPAGDIWAMGPLASGTSDIYMWAGIGNQIWRIDPTQNPAPFTALTNTLTGTPFTPVAAHQRGGITYIATSTRGIYSFNAFTLTTLTTAVNGIAIAQFGDRLVVGNGNILRISDPNNFASWPVANSIAVGSDNEGINGLYVQRNHLVIMKDRSIWILTGVPTVNETLRQVTAFRGTWAQAQGGVTGTDMIHFISKESAVPNVFNGARVFENPHLEMSLPGGVSALPPTHYVLGLSRTAEDRVIISRMQTDLNSVNPPILIKHGGTWTAHDLGFAPTHMAQHLGSYYGNPNNTSDIRYANAVVFASNQGGGISSLYGWNPFIERGGNLQPTPPNVGGDWEQGSATGRFSLPEWHAEAGQNVMVRSVIVDFRKFNPNVASNGPHFEMTVKSLRTYDGSGSPVAYASNPTLQNSNYGYQVSSTFIHDEDPAVTMGLLSSYDGGLLDRATFNLGEQGYGSGFQLDFNFVKSVAIQRITVVLETQDIRY